MSENNAMKWEKMDGLFGEENEVLTGDGFYISFNQDPWLGSDDGGPETALCYDGRCDILNGDFRASYEKLVPQGLEACKAFYRQQSTHADSSWTTRS